MEQVAISAALGIGYETGTREGLSRPGSVHLVRLGARKLHLYSWVQSAAWDH